MKLFFQSQNINLEALSTILKRLREEKKLNKSQLSRKLMISSQLYGQYEPEEGEGKEPGLYFAVKWKEVFGDNLIDILETKVSRETEINSKQPDPSPEQVPGLLYVAIKELVSATQQIAENTKREPRLGLGKVNDKLNRDIPSGKDKKSMD